MASKTAKGKLVVAVVDSANKQTLLELVPDKETKNMQRYAIKPNTFGIVGTLYEPRS